MQNILGYTEQSTFLFTLTKVSSINLEGFKPFFNNLPIDPYIKGRYRFRRLSRFTISGNKLIKLPHGYFFQSKAYNPLIGDIRREFAELEDDLIKLDIFQKLILEFSRFCNLHPEAEIGVHQIRTSCSPDNFGNPAPEGIHRDGTDFIGIFAVDRHNIQGGETHLYMARKEKPVFNKILYPGELILVNDHELFHFTTPIKPIVEASGTRDVFVLTSPSLLLD
ncbi:MAG: 2OG-Fe dioxygenase family protein [Nostocaceae cyanobacterium]|nr:2OG-Fe dioxygenase family protein [Nostocaceae cyanobacterium]